MESTVLFCAYSWNFKCEKQRRSLGSDLFESGEMNFKRFIFSSSKLTPRSSIDTEKVEMKRPKFKTIFLNRAK